MSTIKTVRSGIVFIMDIILIIVLRGCLACRVGQQIPCLVCVETIMDALVVLYDNEKLSGSGAIRSNERLSDFLEVCNEGMRV